MGALIKAQRKQGNGYKLYPEPYISTITHHENKEEYNPFLVPLSYSHVPRFTPRDDPWSKAIQVVIDGRQALVFEKIGTYSDGINIQY